MLKLLLKKTELMCRIGVEMIHLNQLDDVNSLNTYPSCSVEVSLIFSYFHKKIIENETLATLL